MDSSIFVVDEAAAAGGGNKVGVGFPVYPREKPGKDELKKWIATWKDDLGMAGYGPLTRGETPYELAKLRPIPLETAAAGDSDATKDAIDAENRRTQREKEYGQGFGSGGDKNMPRASWRPRRPAKNCDFRCDYGQNP